MRYIKSRSNFLNEKKHNLILEGGLQNDINWGDSLVGRLFSSAFRLGAKAINSKRLDGLGNTLRNRLLKDTLKSVTDENPELKEQLKEFERRLYLLSKEEGLLDVLKTGKIKDIQLYMESMSDDDIEEIINNLTNKNEDSIEALIAIQNWVKNSEPKPKPEPEDEEPEIPEVKVTDGDKDQEEIKQFITKYGDTIIKIINNNPINTTNTTTNTTNITNIQNNYDSNKEELERIIVDLKEKIEKISISEEKIEKIEKLIKEINIKLESPDKVEGDFKQEITNNISIVVNIINKETEKDTEPKKEGEKEPESEKPESKKKKDTVSIGLLKFLRFGGIKTPDYEVDKKTGKVISKMTGDNYEAGPNARWITNTRKAGPKSFLNRIKIAFPEMNLIFNDSLRIKSIKPNTKLNKNDDDNMSFYFVENGKKKQVNIDLSNDTKRWNYVINANRKKGDETYITLSTKNISTLNKNKKNIFKHLKNLWNEKYNVNYKEGSIEKFKKAVKDKNNEFIKKQDNKTGNEFIDKQDNKTGSEVSDDKTGSEVKDGDKSINDSILIEYYSEENNEYFYVINEAVLSDYFQEDLKTQIIVKDDKIETVTFDETKEPLKYNFWVNNYLKPAEVEKNRIEIEKTKTELEKVMKEPKWAINVLDIIKIFKKASRIYIKTNIPSQRTNGEVTVAIANSWETTSGGGVDAKSPGSGPFRNIKLYDKWNKIVIDIIDEFDYALKKDDSRVILSDGSKPIKPKNSIYKFIIDALEGDKISGKNKSDQLTFLQGYFGEENTEDIVDAFAGKLDEPKTDKPKEQAPKVDGDKPEKKKSKFTEVNEINTKKSGLYKLKLTGSYKSDGGYLPNGSNKEVYVYIRNKEERKALYLFEDYNIIKDKMSSKSEFNESGDVSGINKDIYITKLPGTISKKGLVGNIKAINFKDKKSVEFKGSGITIDKIEKINSVYLAKLGTLDGYNIGDTTPFKNS